MVAAASHKANLDFVAHGSVLLFCPCGNGITFIGKLAVCNVIDHVVVFVADEDPVTVLLSGILNQIINGFCVFVSNHNNPLLKTSSFAAIHPPEGWLQFCGGSHAFDFWSNMDEPAPQIYVTRII